MTAAQRHTPGTISSTALTELYDRAAELEARLRAVRLVCEQMSRVADDTEPPRPRPGETFTVGQRLDMAESHAIRRTIAGIYGALQGHGKPEPRIPDPRSPEVPR